MRSTAATLTAPPATLVHAGISPKRTKAIARAETGTKKANVITSYSIHYTKLYDPPVPMRRPATSLVLHPATNSDPSSTRAAFHKSARAALKSFRIASIMRYPPEP